VRRKREDGTFVYEDVAIVRKHVSAESIYASYSKLVKEFKDNSALIISELFNGNIISFDLENRIKAHIGSEAYSKYLSECDIIMILKSVKEIMQPSTTTSLSFKEIEYIRFSWNPKWSLERYINTLEVMYKELCSYGATIPESKRIDLLLYELQRSKKYNSISVNIQLGLLKFPKSYEGFKADLLRLGRTKELNNVDVSENTVDNIGDPMDVVLTSQKHSDNQSVTSTYSKRRRNKKRNNRQKNRQYDNASTTSYGNNVAAIMAIMEIMEIDLMEMVVVTIIMVIITIAKAIIILTIIILITDIVTIITTVIIIVTIVIITIMTIVTITITTITTIRKMVIGVKIIIQQHSWISIMNKLKMYLHIF
jgi:hypothetical protein